MVGTFPNHSCLHLALQPLGMDDAGRCRSHDRFDAFDSSYCEVSDQASEATNEEQGSTDEYHERDPQQHSINQVVRLGELVRSTTLRRSKQQGTRNAQEDG